MKRFGFVRLVLCLGALFFAVHQASALDVTLIGDASVNSAHATTNYGGLSNLYVGNGNTTFLQFNLKTLPAGTTAAQVSQATLTVFVNRVNAAGVVTVSPVTAVWDEYGIKSAAEPPIGSSLGNLSVSVPGQFVSVDVTAQVQAWLTAAAQDTGFALASGAANVLFDSKENDETGHAARLDVTLVSQGPQGVPGPIGPAGVAGPAGANGLPGPQGIQGPVGPVGPVGATGATGSTGAQGPAGAGMVYQNAYNAGRTYAANDAVTYNGSSYISLQNANLGNPPDLAPAFWSLFAAAGATGPQGLQGTTGNTGPIGPQGIQGPAGSIGPVGPTGATGSAGPIGATGATGSAGPAGATGAVGPQGPPVNFQGPWNIGTTYALGDAVSFNGSSYVSIVAGNVGFQPDISNVKWGLLAQAGSVGATGAAGATGATGPIGPQGPQGVQGVQGPAGTSGGGANAVSFAMQFTNPGAGGTYYLSPLNVLTNLAGNTTLGSNFVAMPASCTMSALNVGVNSYSAPAADTTTITVYLDGAATAMSCAVTTNSGNSYRSSCQDATHIFSVAGGHSISVVFSESNTSPINKVTVSLACQ